MRIAIDARAYSWTGIGRYTRNLLAGLARAASEHQYIVLAGVKDISRIELPPDRFTIQPVEDSYYSWREQIMLWRQLQQVRADLFHFTHFNIPLLFHRPYVVTIHDTTRFIFPGQRRSGLWQQLVYEQVLRHAVEHARAVIAVSRSTLDAMQHLPLRLPQCTSVIYEGVDDLFFQPASAADRQKIRMMLGSNADFLLYVGVWMNHKNLHRLLAAFQEIGKAFPDLQLVMTGKPKPGYVNVVRIAQKLGVADRVILTGFVPHHLLPALYQSARCLLFPSLYEGFGLPALEAAASGTPVVASQVSSLPEIMGEAAEYVNPEYVPGIVAAIHRIVTDQQRRQQLIDRGQARAEHFHWQKAVQEHLALYEAAAQRPLR